MQEDWKAFALAALAETKAVVLMVVAVLLPPLLLSVVDLVGIIWESQAAVVVLMALLQHGDVVLLIGVCVVVLTAAEVLW